MLVRHELQSVGVVVRALDAVSPDLQSDQLGVSLHHSADIVALPPALIVQLPDAHSETAKRRRGLARVF
jgi:hypothetical protein